MRNNHTKFMTELGQNRMVTMNQAHDTTARAPAGPRTRRMACT